MKDAPSLAGRAASAAGEGRGGGSARISAADVEKSFGATANESPMSVPPLTPERLPPPWGRVGWGQQTNQRSFLKYPRQTHQETEIHEPTIGYERNAIYPSPALLRAPRKMQSHFAWEPARCGLRPAREGAVRRKLQTFIPASATRNPAHLHTPERSRCMYSHPPKVSDKARRRRQYAFVRRGDATPYEAFGGWL